MLKRFALSLIVVVLFSALCTHMVIRSWAR
jgi:hypothetical protein